MGGALIYRQIRAPLEHGGVFIDPKPEKFEAVLRHNQKRQSRSDATIVDHNLADLAREARSALLQQATEYSREYRDVPTPLPEAPLLMAGHQGGLYHPGVWFKNFLLDALAQKHRATAINVIMDSDLFRSPSIRVPGGSIEKPTLSDIPFDRHAAEIPAEERYLIDADLWNSFGQRVEEKIKPLVPNPFITNFWPMASIGNREAIPIGEAIAQARHQTEGEWGLENLEIPLSSVVDSDPFRWFFLHFLDRLASVQEIYNHALFEYRALHRIRNQAHPAPDLIIERDWIESPFWIWTQEDKNRRRLFARHGSKELEISDRAGFQESLPLPSQDSEVAIDKLALWAKQGIKIRPRALTATLYLRLFLSDLFIHGIGGAKYDQITDLLMEKIFAVSPPRYVTASATMVLPIQRERVESSDLAQIRQGIRDLRYHPEKHLEQMDGPLDAETKLEIESLVSAKSGWVKQDLPRGERLQRHRGIESVNLRLQPHLAAQRSKLLKDESSISGKLQREKLLGSREFSFVLFPEEDLRQCLLDSCERVP